MNERKLHLAASQGVSGLRWVRLPPAPSVLSYCRSRRSTCSLRSSSGFDAIAKIARRITSVALMSEASAIVRRPLRKDSVADHELTTALSFWPAGKTNSLSASVGFLAQSQVSVAGGANARSIAFLRSSSKSPKPFQCFPRTIIHGAFHLCFVLSEGCAYAS